MSELQCRLTQLYRIFLGFFLFWKIFKKTKFVNPAEADLWTGKAAIDAQVWSVSTPKNVWEKVSPALRFCPTTGLDG